ncbi:hypothetical protein L1987_19373 [Smallanthus sonchifolius]|uniref:Uncharacterized protein n=1 Tax=Smallanthus sonchifolius TaxID=185202 RepID=A0ACB9IQ24_9ASTR|nr:hypothetical protein L1987_19373 [Smallanthus sonchifolius]
MGRNCMLYGYMHILNFSCLVYKFTFLAKSSKIISYQPRYLEAVCCVAYYISGVWRVSSQRKTKNLKEICSLGKKLGQGFNAQTLKKNQTSLTKHRGEIEGRDLHPHSSIDKSFDWAHKQTLR